MQSLNVIKHKQNIEMLVMKQKKTIAPYCTFCSNNSIFAKEKNATDDVEDDSC